jgi:hypothetical protein
MKIKTSGFTPEQIKQAEKLELEQTYFENLSELEKKLNIEDQKLFSSTRDDIIEGRTTPLEMLENYAVKGDVGKEAYPSLSRYMQKIREKFMKKAVDAGREDTIPKYLDRYSKNLKKDK